MGLKVLQDLEKNLEILRKKHQNEKDIKHPKIERGKSQSSRTNQSGSILEISVGHSVSTFPRAWESFASVSEPSGASDCLS